MADLMLYLGMVLNSCISCIEIFISYIWYIPILGSYLGNIIFSFIILRFAIELFRKWILGPYRNNHTNKKEEKELQKLKEQRKKGVKDND